MAESVSAGNALSKPPLAIHSVRDQHRPDLAQLQGLRAEAAQELGHHGDLARAREQEPAPGPAGHDRGSELEIER
jgi:hypothetical protein